MQKSRAKSVPAFILGIDLGTNSLGWALVGLGGDGKPEKLLRCGARVFDAGMEGDIESGQEESRNKKRRQMRMQRRQIERRARRQRKVFHLLQNYGLLPEGRVITSEGIQNALNTLDASILASAWFAAQCASNKFKQPEQVLPYILRASALDEPLPPDYLGRALYHLAQRRGFLSNRRAPRKEDEDLGKVESGISELRNEMAASGARTLGEYFARLDPFERRIRQRWTARRMYQDEFERVWEAQARYHPEILTPKRRKELYSAIFYQRPLWFPESLVGTCELEPGEPRAPRYAFLAQRFRLLQAVNNLRLEIDGSERGLTLEERSKLIQELELGGDLTFAQVRNKVLKLPRQARFTVERGGEKNLRGNRTTARFYEVFGERWTEMSATEHEQALQDVLSIEKEETLRRRAMNYWKLGEEHATKFASISLEPDYFNLSRKAIEKVLPLLETGTTYAEARRQLYHEKFEARPPLDSLPRVDGEEARQAVGEIRNPAVTRSLTELRKVVNAIVRQYGKPAEVRVELARDLKNPKKARQSISERMRENEKAREEAKEKILKEAGIPHPRRDDIRKALLWDECGGICPYTGKSIAFKDLFGDSPQFDIEHIIPSERSFDDSFKNLTLCEIHENRHVKGGSTPWETYHGDPERYEQILDRVKRFHSPSAHAKLYRFQMTETEAAEFVNKFVERQLNDTRYASRLAAKYLAMLYGGLSDDTRTRRVHVTSGEATAQLRSAWKLNGILNDGPTRGGGEIRKTRDDHRHHAVDAVAIALTDDGMIQRLSHAAQAARDRGDRKLGSVEGPWPDFVDSVRKEISRVVVSHRVSKKVSGALHEETIYSRPFQRTDAKGKTIEAVHVRRKLSAITASELEAIVDDAVRRLVQEKLVALGAGNPKKVFSVEQNLPRFPSSGVPIKSVRIEKREPAKPLSEGRSARHVTSESNHHVEIYAEIKADGSEGRWDGEVVSMLEAYRRKKAGRPVVEKDHGTLVKFKFSLCPGEAIECDDGNGGSSRWVVRGATAQNGSPRIFLVRHNDARQRKEMESEAYWRPFLNPLHQRNARKVSVTPLGEVREAHD